MPERLDHVGTPLPFRKGSLGEGENGFKLYLATLFFELDERSPKNIKKVYSLLYLQKNAYLCIACQRVGIKKHKVSYFSKSLFQTPKKT